MFSQKDYALHSRSLDCDANIFVFRFSIVYLPKKMETEKYHKAADSPLLCDITEIWKK